MSTPCNLPVIAVLAAAFLAPAGQNTPSTAPSPVRLVDDGAAVELALADVNLADFLVAAQPILGVPIQSLPDEVVPPHLHQLGVQRVPLAAFRDAFDAVLSREGFWNWDDTSGGAPVIVVRKALAGKFLGKIPFTPRVIGPEELAAGPAQRGPLYTTAFPLKHVPARNLLIIAMPFLDSANETIAHIEGSNQLLVTASREHLLAIRDALAQVDVPGPESPGVGLQVTALEQRLAEIDKRLAVLESKGDR